MQRETQKERTILCKYDPIEVRIKRINKFFPNFLIKFNINKKRLVNIK